MITWPRSIFGYDFFISYRRGAEITQYALNLYDELQKRNYRCFVDREEFEAGPDFERRLVRAVRASSILLLVVAPDTAGSEYVQLEIRTALKKQRRIVPINVAHSYVAEQWPDLAARDIVWIDETKTNLAAGKPSAEVLDDIERSQKKSRLNAVRQRILVSTVLLLSFLLVLSGYFWCQEREQANIALARQLAAQSQLVVTEQPSLLERAALLGVESVRRQSSLEADIALRNSAHLLPTLLRQLNSDKFFNKVVVSPDGKLVATAAADRLSAFDNALNAKLFQISHAGEISSICFSPHGRLLAAVSEDGTAKIIDTARQKKIYQLHHGAGVRAVTFSSDERLLATASEDRTAAVWNVENGRELARLPHPDWVEDIKFSPDANLVVTGSQDQTARIWNLHPLRLIAAVRFSHRQSEEKSLMKGTRRTQSVAFSPDGRWVAASGLDGEVTLLDTKTWKEVFRLQHDSAISAVAFTPDSRTLLTVPSGAIIVWSVSDGRRIGELKHSGLVYDMAFSPDGTFLATASQDQTARVWETTSWSEVFRVCDEDAVASVAFRDSATLITAGRSLRLWALNIGRKRVLTSAGTVLGIAFSPDGTTLAAASPGGRVWNTYDWRSRDLTPEMDVRAVNFSADGKRLAFGSNDGEVAVFETGSWENLYKYKLHTQGVNSVAFSPDGRFVASGSRDGTAVAWETVTKHVSWRYATEDNIEIEGVCFSPDGEWLAIAIGQPAFGIPGKVVIVNWRTRKEVGALDTSADPEVLAWSPDGRVIAAGLGDGSILVLKAGKWDNKIATLGNQDVIRDVKFSKSGRFLASGGADGTVRLWDASTWAEVSRLRLPSVVIGVAFNADESTFAASFNNVIQIDLVEPRDLIREACLHLSRPLNADEWRLYLPSQPYRKTCADEKPWNATQSK